ncbi:MAG: hypothetical protein N2691_05705, partial [Patescibacteria group bacterium]|nr:hypothetical protein [Patescibacteria group bacterium]
MWRLYPAQFIPLYFLFPATALAVTLPPNIPRDTPTEVAKIVVESPRLPTPEEPVPVADDGRFLIPPPNPGTDIGLMGQDHAYTVTFRGNGESVVSLRIAFSNTGTKTMEALAIRVPRITPQDIVAFQIKREPQCIRYMPYRYDPSNPYDNPQCAEYRKPDYFEPWWDTATYFRSETILKGDKIIIDLPNPVAPNESGSVIVYYRGTGYATRNWTGGWNYVFETATVSDP